MFVSMLRPNLSPTKKLSLCTSHSRIPIVRRWRPSHSVPVQVHLFSSVQNLGRVSYKRKGAGKPETEATKSEAYTGKAMSRPLLTTNQRIDWYLDWDGTITKRDTLDTLVNIAAQQKPDENIDEKWDRLTQRYIVDYTFTYDDHNKKLRTTVPEEKEFLKILEAPERRSVDRVSDSGIFKGLVPEMIKQGAKRAVENREVQIRPGYVNFAENCMARWASGMDRTHEAFTIISVNWSARFIEECLQVIRTWGGPSMINPVICANELEHIYSKAESMRRIESYDRSRGGPDDVGPEETPSTGRIVPGPGMQSRIIFSRDKLELFSKREVPNVEGLSAPKVYIGDSWTDLECLLAADLGICIRDDPMTEAQRRLADSFERLGIQCLRLLDILDHPEPKTDEWSVVWARDFREVVIWLRWRGMTQDCRKEVRRNLQQKLESGSDSAAIMLYATDSEGD